MTKEFLDRPEVGAPVEQVGGERVPQGMWMGPRQPRRARHRAPGPAAQPAPDVRGGEPAARFGEEQRRVGGAPDADAVALDESGLLSEGSGQNLFLVRDHAIYTPGIGSSVLQGITRDTVLTLSRDLGFEIRETSIPREFLYLADEMFMTGTAAKVTPIRSVDRIPVGAGKRGPITEALQSAFFGLFNGNRPQSINHAFIFSDITNRKNIGIASPHVFIDENTLLDTQTSSLSKINIRLDTRAYKK